MVREMVGGCCVCLDERGWNENPLVYCDGSGCNVAVHQACYGIVKVPSGPWFCCKCRSQERIARVKCELCPLREGALKRTDSGGWAHVVCALYIPEVRFGDVSTMEPIIFSSVPHDRFLKNCYICEENGRESRTSTGACMNCHRSGCKLSFHVTCAQSKRQLCEEASINGHVQYVGYCSIHWSKRFKQPSVLHPTPPNECEMRKQGKEKKSVGRCRNDSTSSTNSVDITTSKARGKKGKLNELDTKSTDSKFEGLLSPAKADEANSEPYTKSLIDAALPNGQVRVKSASSFTVNGLLGTENTSSKINSPLNTPVVAQHYKEESDRPDITSSSMDSQTEHTETDDLKVHKSELKKKKLKDKEKLKKKLKSKSEKLKDIHKGKEKDRSKDISKKKKREKHDDGNNKDTNHTKDKTNDKKRKYPQPSQLGTLENGKISSWDSVTPKLKETPDNFQEFLEHQWSESTQFLASKAEHFDVASLLTCLHQLKADNIKLEKKLTNLQSRRDRLLGVNARLAATIAAGSTNQQNGTTHTAPPLSVMLSKLNDDVTSIPKAKKCKKSTNPADDVKKLDVRRSVNDVHRSVNSPDLVMLAAASAKFENHSRQSIVSDRIIPHDEKPLLDQSSSNDTAPHLSLLQPHVPFVPPTSTINTMSSQDILTLQRNYRNHMEFFGESAEPKD